MRVRTCELFAEVMMPQIYGKHERNITSGSFVDNGEKRLRDCSGTTELSEVVFCLRTAVTTNVTSGLHESETNIFFTHLLFYAK